MRKRAVLLTAAALLAGILTGCQNNGKVQLSEIKTDKYVTLGEYTGLTAAAPKAQVSDEEVQIAIDNLMNQNIELVENNDKIVEEGDTVDIAYVGKIDGEAFEGGSSDSFDLLIGSGQFIEGFEEGLIGTKAGETKDLHLKFDENYGKEELNGKDVIFTVTVNAVKVMPELTDAMVPQLNSKCTTVEELKQAVYDSIYQQAEYEYETAIENALIEQIADNSTFKKEPPKAMIDDYIQRSRKNLEMMASYYGMSFSEMITNFYQMTEEEFEEEIRPGCVESAQKDIMLQAIANKEKLNPSQEDIEAAMQEEATELGYESVEAYKEVIDTSNYKDYTMVKSVLSFVKENSTVTAE